jgi:hypothetical protein
VVEVQVTLSEVRVAAYRGSAQVEWSDGLHEMPPGQSWTNVPVVVAPPPPPVVVAPPPPPPPVVAAPQKKSPRIESPPPPVTSVEEPPDEPRHVPPPAMVKPPSALTVEASSLERAVKALRQDRDAVAALRAIEEHLVAHPHGLLRNEAQLTRTEALLKLGRRSEALQSLERVSLAGMPRSTEFMVIRGELLAEAGRCKEAQRDFAHVVDGRDTLAERALVGRADCRAQSGDDSGARADLRDYLSRFPDGKFVDRARRALGGL